MSIKPRTGKCTDCGPEEPHRYIMAGRCCVSPHFHYQKHRAAVAADKAKDKKKAKTLRTSAKSGMTLGQWFNNQITMMPNECENCGEYLNPYAPWSARAYIAHLVPKRNIESVMVHPLNRMFLCIDCHSNYDNWLNKDIMQMNCWPIAVARFEKFKHLIEQSEYKHLRDCFKDLM